MLLTRRLASMARFLGAAATFAALIVGNAAAQAPATAESAKTWLDRRQPIEDHLKTAEVVKMEPIGVGVTKPWRVYLAAGGPVDQMAFKPIRPGIHGGFWESYRSEIAAYELDKLLGLDMIPPTVERRIKGDLGAAIMWTAPARSFKEMGGVPSPPSVRLASWNRQMVRSKMFDNLICNIDPNMGNWLVDPEWNLILIDHTRAFTTRKNMVHDMTRVDRELWDRMKALTEESLTAALGTWVGKGEIRAMLERRDRMGQLIQKLVAAKGESEVFIQ